jgi:hypothetical protein
VSNIGPNRAHHLVETTGESGFPMVNPNPGVISRSGRSLDSLSLTFRLSHRVKDRIYWTKVSINTFVSVVHRRCRPTRDETIVSFCIRRDFSRAVEAQQRSGLKSTCENWRKATAGPRSTSLRAGSPLRYPGFPVELGSVGEFHAVPARRDHTRGRW